MTKTELIDELLKHRYAHRGLHNKPAVPENSMAAFRRAVEEGFGMELDIHITKDGKLAVIHDSSLKRTAGVDLIIEDLTLEEAQIYFLEESEEVIPEFQDLLDLVAGRTPLIVELKTGKTADGEDTTERLCRAAVEALDSYSAKYADQAPCLYCVESFNPSAVKWFRANRPDVVRGQLSGRFNKPGENKIPGMHKFLMETLLVNKMGTPDFLAFNYDDRDVKALQKYQGPLFFWTIRDYTDLVNAEQLGAAVIFEKFNPKDYE